MRRRRHEITAAAGPRGGRNRPLPGGGSAAARGWPRAAPLTPDRPRAKGGRVQGGRRSQAPSSDREMNAHSAASAKGSRPPSRSRSTRSQRVAISGAWVTSTSVAPWRSRRPKRSSMIVAPVAPSRLPVGSSASRISRPRHRRAGERDPLLLAAGELRRVVVAPRARAPSPRARPPRAGRRRARRRAPAASPRSRWRSSSGSGGRTGRPRPCDRGGSGPARPRPWRSGPGRARSRGRRSPPPARPSASAARTCPSRRARPAPASRRAPPPA